MVLAAPAASTVCSSPSRKKEIEDVLAAKIIEKRGEDVRRIDLSAKDGQIQIEMEG